MDSGSYIELLLQPQDDVSRPSKGAASIDHVDETQTQPSLSTRSTLTVLTDSPNVPLSVTKAETRRREIVAHIGTGHIQHPSLFEQSFAGLQGEATAFSTLTRPTLHCGPRWVGICTKYTRESQLGADFLKLLLKLQQLWAKNPIQTDIFKILDTHKILLPDDRNASHFLRPDIFIQGTGSLFPVRSRLGNKPVWSSCVAIGDAKLSVGKRKMDTFGQLGTYAEQVFSAQENRRYLPTFYFDNSHLVWCIFDRGGAVKGDIVEFHRDYWKLCAVLLYFLVGGRDLGFDTSIRYDGNVALIRTTPPPGQIDSASQEDTILYIPEATYKVHRTLFHSTNIRGSGSIYWLVQHQSPLDDPRRDDEGNWYIIKDAWVIGGCEGERDIYGRIRRISTLDSNQDCASLDVLPGGQGIAPLLFTHNIYSNNKLDSVSTNRPEGVNTHSADNRVHTRAVFRTTPGAKLLDHFESTMELLLAIRDAVQGHRRLHNHGVLHRRITPFRILIQPDAQEGNRGVLLDFGAALQNDSPTPGGVRGCPAFSSRAVCRASERGLTYSPSYFDDLESFFYVLYYLVVCYPPTGSLKPHSIPEPVSKWFSIDGGGESKIAMISELTLPYFIHDSFHPVVSKLIMGLHHFFRKHYAIAASMDIPWSLEPEEGYGEFLRLLEDAIDGLRVYQPATNPGEGPPSTNTLGVAPSTQDVPKEPSLYYGGTERPDDYPVVHTPTTGPSLVQRRPEKRSRSPSPSSSKRIKSGPCHELGTKNL